MSRTAKAIGGALQVANAMLSGAPARIREPDSVEQVAEAPKRLDGVGMGEELERAMRALRASEPPKVPKQRKRYLFS